MFKQGPNFKSNQFLKFVSNLAQELFIKCYFKLY